MASAAHLLIAARPSAYDLLRGYLDASCTVVGGDTLDTALRALEEHHDICLILATVSFDESRMFDLLRLCRAKYRDIPVVCCRAFDHDVPKVSVEAMRIASEALGAVAFIDLPGLEKRFGEERLAAEFRKAVFQYLGKPK